MTVKEVIEELQKFPQDMEVCDAFFEDVETVIEATYIHTNFPYDKPDKQVVIII